MKLADHLDANGLSLKKARIDPVASDPTGLGASDEGRLIYNTTDDVIKVWTGAAWVEVGSGTGGDLPKGQLAYVEKTTDQGSITAETDITGLSATVDVASGRRIRLTAQVHFHTTPADTDVLIYIKEGATYLARSSTQVRLANTAMTVICTKTIVSPSAGSHTYKVSIDNGATTTTVWAASTRPCTFEVEDLGPA